MTKLNDFVKQKDFSLGLPEGDTIIELATTEAEDSIFKDRKTGEEKPTYKLTLPNGEVYTVPKTVMNEIKQLEAKGAVRVRVTRTGTQLNTKYTVVKIWVWGVLFQP